MTISAMCQTIPFLERDTISPKGYRCPYSAKLAKNHVVWSGLAHPCFYFLSTCTLSPVQKSPTSHYPKYPKFTVSFPGKIPANDQNDSGHYQIPPSPKRCHSLCGPGECSLSWPTCTGRPLTVSVFLTGYATLGAAFSVPNLSQ